MKSLRTVCLCVSILLAACGSVPPEPGPASGRYSVAELSSVYATLEQITSASDLIATVQLTGEKQQVEYGSARFTVTDLLIHRVIKGDINTEKQTIRLLELSGFDLHTDKNPEYLLFLREYPGPVIEDGYTVTGVYQGKFKYRNLQVIYDAHLHGGVQTFQAELSGLSLSEVEASISRALSASD